MLSVVFLPLVYLLLDPGWHGTVWEDLVQIKLVGEQHHWCYQHLTC